MINYRPILKLIFLLFSLSVMNEVLAQGPPGPPTGGPGGPGCWPPPCVPIDGGISVLLVAGALYGGKKIYDISLTKKE